MTIAFEDADEGIVVLRLADAAGQNHLDAALCEKLAEALTAADRPTTRVLVLAGLPDIFCAGAPPALLEALKARQPGLAIADLALPAQLLAFPLPTIAAMAGHAIGGGFTLGLCCDMRVAATTRRYGANFTDHGFTPGMGTTGLLPPLVGHALACEMMMGGKLYRGSELAGTGVFNAVVPAGEVEATALDLARRLAEKPRHVLTLLKETLAAPRRVALEAALVREHAMHAVCFADRQAP